ncbi:MAG: GNAT family N-acetyltransferase [Gemmatimonadales bacterium]
MIQHLTEQTRFALRLPQGVAQLDYEMIAPDWMDIQSTWVPEAARGHGTGARLVEAALEYARARGFKVRPSCWYARAWIGDHPAYHDLLRE